MTLNVDAIRKRLNTLQRNENKASVKWRPTPDTKARVRLIPYKYGDDGVPFVELYFHYGINNKTYVSPISYGDPDPFVETAQRLKATGDREDWLVARRLEPKLRTYAPIVVRGEEAQGVKFWGFGKTVYQSLLTFMADEDWGDISDPENGRDFIIQYDSKETAGTNYPVTTITVKPDRTPLVEESELLKKLLENQPNHEDVFPAPTYDELKEALDSWMNPEEAEDNGSGNLDSLMPKVEAKNKSETESASTSVPDDVTEAFDDLFNEKE